MRVLIAGFLGGGGGSSAGGGGYGGETFACLASTYGRGGNHQQVGQDGGAGGDGRRQIQKFYCLLTFIFF